MTIVNKIIHRFVRPRYEYMNPDGELFSQIIPVNTQAYSYEKIPGANPNLPDSYIIRYVLGTGGSTYAQIANGQGKDKDGNIIPELSKEFVIRSDPQLIALITKLIKEQVVFSSYLTSDIDNNPFATKEALDTAEAWYVNGESVTPKLNDYVIVLSDESRPTGSGENPTTRYVCVDIVEDRPVWAFQYEVNNSNFTPEQWAAINSGVNTEKVELYDSYEDQIAILLDHIANKENPHEVTAEQIGLGNVDNTSDLDKPISTATQEALDNITSTLESHIENDNVHVTAEEKETWNSKQDALKMGNHIEIKNDVITVLDDLSTYDNRTSRFVSKDTDDLDNYYTKEELDKYLVGGNYKYNGEVATYADLPHPLVPFGDDYYSLIWITANRLQYIDTGYHCNQNTEIYLKVKLNRGDNYLYSTIMNEPYKVGLAVNYGANTGVAYFGNQEIEVSIEDLKDTETEIILNRNGIFFDGVQVGWFDETEDFTTESTLFVPKWNSSDTHSMNLNVYAFRISQRNIFMRDYYPAISKEDESLVGLYDKVDNSFHVSDGEFPFVPGDYTSSVLGGTVYKVLDENRFYMWYKNDWINVAELHTAGVGISIDKDGTINNIDDIIIHGESQFDENRIADLTEIIDQKVDHFKELPEPTEENLGWIVQYIGPDDGYFKNGLFYKVVITEESGEEEYIWEKIDTTDISEKVDKTHDAFKIYGTDKDGNQTYYDKEDFGKVDDVRLNGVSVVGIKEEKVADLDLVAADSEYHNDAVESIDNVQQALDILMNFHYYQPPKGSFTVRQGNTAIGSQTAEIGTVFNAPFSLEWSLTNRTPDLSTDIGYYKYPDGVIHNNLSKSYDTRDKTPDERYMSNITSNTRNESKTFSYYYEDNHTIRPAGNNNKTYSANVTLTFKAKMYYGVSTKPSLTDAEIRALTSEWCTNQDSFTTSTEGGSRVNYRVFGPYTNPNDFYVYLIFPTDDSTRGKGIKFSQGGFGTNDYLLTQRNIESSTGLTNVQYNIYRFKSNSTFDGGSTTSIKVEKA